MKSIYALSLVLAGVLLIECVLLVLFMIARVEEKWGKHYHFTINHTKPERLTTVIYYYPTSRNGTTRDQNIDCMYMYMFLVLVGLKYIRSLILVAESCMQQLLLNY